MNSPDGLLPLDDQEFIKCFDVYFPQHHQQLKISKKECKREIEELKRNIVKIIKNKKRIRKEIGEIETKIVAAKEAYHKANVMVKRAQIEYNNVKADIDEIFKVDLLELQRCEKIRDEVKKTWEEYHAEYESLPLVKALREQELELQSLVDKKVQQEREIENLTEAAKQQHKRDWQEFCELMVDFAQMMVDKKDCEKLTEENHKLEEELEELIAEHDALVRLNEEKEKEQKELACFPMPPPKLDFPQVKSKPSIMNRNIHFRIEKKIIEDDAISVTTEILEDMCIADIPSKSMIFDAADDESRNPKHSSFSNLKRHSIAQGELSENNKDLDQISRRSEKHEDLQKSETLRVLQSNLKKNEEPLIKKLKTDSGKGVENTSKDNTIDPNHLNKPQIKSIENVNYDIPPHVKKTSMGLSNLSVESNMFPLRYCESYIGDVSNSMPQNFPETSGLSDMDHGVSQFAMFRNLKMSPIRNFEGPADNKNTEVKNMQKDQKTSKNTDQESNENSEFGFSTFMMSSNKNDFQFDFS